MVRKRSSSPYSTPLLPFPQDVEQACVAVRVPSALYTQKQLNIEDIPSPSTAYIPSPQPTNGTSLDALPPVSAQLPTISPDYPRSLADVLKRVEAASVTRTEKNLVAMLGTTVTRMTEWLHRSAEEIPIAELAELIPGFKLHLTKSRYEYNSVRSYVNFAQILLRKAKQMGWREANPELEAAWQPILAVNVKKPSVTSIVRYAVRNGLRPEVFGDAHLDQWERTTLTRQITASHVRLVKWAFRSLVLRHGFPTGLSDNRRPGGHCYRVPFDEFPEPLHSQVLQLMAYKEAKYFPGRPNRCRHRKVTSKQMRDLICRIVGFLRLRGRTVTELEEVVSRDTMEQYVAWQINERKNTGTALATWLRLLLTSAKRFPSLSHVDFSWIFDFLESIPTEDDERLKQENKKAKWVPLAELQAIPAKIRERRLSQQNASPLKVALMARDELLMTHVTLMPWRERNLIECVVAPRSDGGNLFKEPLPQPSSKARPEWVDDILSKDPKATFWQYRFEPEQTKANDRAVEAIVPRRLVGLLEEYLQVHRPVLVCSEDPRTLYVSSFGGKLSGEALWKVIGNLTYKYTGRWVNPHLLRDIFTVGWLEDHPGDYNTPAKMLWHKSPRMLERVYGANFDESYAGKNVEEWIEKKAK